MVISAALYAIIGFVLHAIPLFSFFAGVPLCIAYYHGGYRFLVYVGGMFCALLSLQYLVVPLFLQEIESYQFSRTAIYIRIGLAVSLTLWYVLHRTRFFTRISIVSLLLSFFWIPQTRFVSEVFENITLTEAIDFMLPPFSIEIVQLLLMSSLMTVSFVLIMFSISVAKVLAFRSRIALHDLLQYFFVGVHRVYRPTQIISLVVLAVLVYVSSLFTSQIFLIIMLNIFFFSFATILLYGYILFYFVLMQRVRSSFTLKLYPLLVILMLVPYVNMALTAYFLLLVVRQSFGRTKVVEF